MDARKSKFVDARAQATDARASKAWPTPAQVAHRAPPRVVELLDKFGKFQRLAAARALADAPRPPERRLEGFAAPRSFATWRPTTLQQWRPRGRRRAGRPPSPRRRPHGLGSGSSTRSASSGWYASAPRSASTINKPAAARCFPESAPGSPSAATKKGTGASRSAWSCVGAPARARPPPKPAGQRRQAVTQAAAAPGPRRRRRPGARRARPPAPAAVRAGSPGKSSGTLVAAAAMAP